MKPTSARLLLAVTICGAVGGWSLVVIVEGLTGRALAVPVLAGSALWLLAIAFVIWGAVLRPRLEARIDPTTRPGIDPLPWTGGGPGSSDGCGGVPRMCCRRRRLLRDRDCDCCRGSRDTGGIPSFLGFRPGSKWFRRR